MREARETVELKRKRENDKRMLLGQDPLPPETIHIEI